MLTTGQTPFFQPDKHNRTHRTNTDTQV